MLTAGGSLIDFKMKLFIKLDRLENGRMNSKTKACIPVFSAKLRDPD